MQIRGRDFGSTTTKLSETSNEDFERAAPPQLEIEDAIEVACGLRGTWPDPEQPDPACEDHYAGQEVDVRDVVDAQAEDLWEFVVVHMPWVPLFAAGWSVVPRALALLRQVPHAASHSRDSERLLHSASEFVVCIGVSILGM